VHLGHETFAHGETLSLVVLACCPIPWRCAIYVTKPSPCIAVCYCIIYMAICQGFTCLWRGIYERCEFSCPLWNSGQRHPLTAVSHQCMAQTRTGTGETPPSSKTGPATPQAQLTVKVGVPEVAGLPVQVPPGLALDVGGVAKGKPAVGPALPCTEAGNR